MNKMPKKNKKQKKEIKKQNINFNNISIVIIIITVKQHRKIDSLKLNHFLYIYINCFGCS